MVDWVSKLYQFYRIDLDDWKEAKRAFTVEERLPGKKRRTYRKNNKENLPKLQMSPTSLDTTLQPKAKQETSTETMMATTRSQTKASSSTSESEKNTNRLAIEQPPISEVYPEFTMGHIQLGSGSESTVQETEPEFLPDEETQEKGI